eukprot:CAMPEP_0174717522 /NCGR_PEP_ID=MMETSP1094-20130205/26478_1 /TAXON_ID=156173 /ORGANISM="Chrysochromulina brevifilum, Strain UTEX LB 985" /LENGTH=40 /DNA_ID= /DNA_START= /DNA_END= /DNA_ORIENTATION=
MATSASMSAPPPPSVTAAGGAAACACIPGPITSGSSEGGS